MKKYNCEYRNSALLNIGDKWQMKIEAANPKEAYEKFIEKVGEYPEEVIVEINWLNNEIFDDHIDKELQEKIIGQEKLELEQKKAEQEKTTTKPTPEKSATISSAPEGVTSMKNPYIIPSSIIAGAILIGVWILKDSNEKSQNQLIQQIQDKKSGEQVEEVQEKESVSDIAGRIARELKLDINVREGKIRPSHVASGFYCKHGYFDINGKFGKAECYRSHD